MDLEIAGRKALVGGASAGLGFPCAQAFARADLALAIVARAEAPLREAATAMQAIGSAPVAWVAADVATAEGRERNFSQHGAFDTIITHAGGPTPGDFRHWDRDTWLRALDANMLTPIRQARIAKRLGPPDEFGATCAFLCSAHSGYINGQNVLMDGGRFRERFSYRVIACCDVSSCRHVH